MTDNNNDTISREEAERKFVTKESFNPAQFVTKDAFEPVKLAVYGVVALLLTGVITTLLALVLRK